MANEKVSQMISLPATELVGGDLLLITDVSARESKKLSVADLLLYVETTGSFNAGHAVNADSASYLNVIGRNINVSSSTVSVTSSYSHFAERVLRADTASIADTASYVNLTGISEVATASFLKLLPGAQNGTASYAKTASFVNASKTSSFLLYTPGSNNGTASYSISGSFAFNCLTASTISNLDLINATTATSASWASASLTSSYTLGNGIISYQSVLSYVKQAGTGGTILKPFPIFGRTLFNRLEVKILPRSVNSTFLIILSTVVGNGFSGGDTTTALWRSSSVSLGPLIAEIGSVSDGDNRAETLVTSYVDRPQYDHTTPVTYSAQVFNNSGAAWYVNRDKNNSHFGTSSITVIEFGL